MRSALIFCSRDDKRYTEKKNKSERARRKKEDIARLRGLVDLALSVDPRIKRIKQEEKEARDAKKKGKAGALNGVSAKQKEEEDKKKAEEEAKKKEEEEKVTVASFSIYNSLLTFLPRSRVLRQRRPRLQLPTPRRRPGGKPALTGTRHNARSVLCSSSLDLEISVTPLAIHPALSTTCLNVPPCSNLVSSSTSWPTSDLLRSSCRTALDVGLGELCSTRSNFLGHRRKRRRRTCLRFDSTGGHFLPVRTTLARLSALVFAPSIKGLPDRFQLAIPPLLSTTS